MRIRRVLAGIVLGFVSVLSLAWGQPASAEEGLGSGVCEASSRAYEKVFKRDAPWYCTT